MEKKKSTIRRQSQRQRSEMRLSMSCTPSSWRRYVVAGAALCCSIQALAQKSRSAREGDDEPDPTE